MLDVLFINPSNQSEIYQNLSSHYAAIEPPTWILLLAQSVRSRGFNVQILDTNAEQLNDEQSLERVRELKPKLLCFVVYGQNVNSGCVGMSGATRLSKWLKDNKVDFPIGFIGSYVQSLPKKTLEDEASIDFIFNGEGVYSLWNLLKKPIIDINNLENIKGLVWRKNGEIVFNEPEKIVSSTDMDSHLPGYAFDLLPFKNKPFDLYRSPMWHTGYIEEQRSPYVAIQTSIGCPYKCHFCCINTINKNDNQEIAVASNYSGSRHWSPEFVITVFDQLVKLGVTTIKITDELFFYDKRRYKPLLEKLVERGYGEILNLWVYSRIDVLANDEILQLAKKAGIKFIALGIEASRREVRLEISKGKFQDVDIKEVVKRVENAGIEVIANYIFGLPKETRESMQETFDLAVELNTMAFNAYAVTLLAGTYLYSEALKRGARVPEKYSEFSFHSYDSVCGCTNELSSGEILKFRDESYNKYHSNPTFLKKVAAKYGQKAADDTLLMAQIKLKRKLVEQEELYDKQS